MNTDFVKTDFFALLKVMRWLYRDKERWGHGDFYVKSTKYAYLIEAWESTCIEDTAIAEKWSEDDWWDKAYDEVAWRHEEIVADELEPLGTIIFDGLLDGDAAWGLSVVVVRRHDHPPPSRTLHPDTTSSQS